MFHCGLVSCHHHIGLICLIFDHKFQNAIPYVVSWPSQPRWPQLLISFVFVARLIFSKKCGYCAVHPPRINWGKKPIKLPLFNDLFGSICKYATVTHSCFTDFKHCQPLRSSVINTGFVQKFTSKISGRHSVKIFETKHWCSFK